MERRSSPSRLWLWEKKATSPSVLAPVETRLTLSGPSR
jgi:hypothetical protein